MLIMQGDYTSKKTGEAVKSLRLVKSLPSSLTIWI